MTAGCIWIPQEDVPKIMAETLDFADWYRQQGWSAELSGSSPPPNYSAGSSCFGAGNAGADKSAAPS